MTINHAICLVLAIGSACAVGAMPSACRTVFVDEEGVMRWKDGGDEVSLFGVNYYLPFAFDFRDISGLGLDFRRTLEEDVSHFRRLGLTCLRIHCYDRQISNRSGHLVGNRHLDLLDELVSVCASNGLYTVLTPIAWWGGPFEGSTNGFSGVHTMRQLTSDRSTWPLQARYLKEFGEHVNRFTGKRYADDPAILCFELINEPLYPRGHPDREVTAYVNALAAGLRASGTAKPLFFNSWQNRNAAVGEAAVDGVTGSSYPTGLRAGHALAGSQLGRVKASTLRPDRSIAQKAKIIYEFDCADTPGAYMYPAMARLFRHEGAQVAAQFQYDLLPLADLNTSWQTHHLNLVYSPAKALSFAIAAEVFRRSPRGCPYVPSADVMDFPPFRIDAARNLSQMCTDEDFLYTADTLDKPKHVGGLRRVWGVGSSPVASSTGNGIYFLDKAMDGVWRLQLYPSVFVVRDEYSGGKRRKVELLPASPSLTIRLPDLGRSFRARPFVDDGRIAAHAHDGNLMIAPGDYVLENVARYGERERGAVARLEIPAYCSRPPDQRAAGCRIDGAVAQWAHGVPLCFNVSALGATNISVTIHTASGRETRSFPVRLCSRPEDWDYLDIDAAMASAFRGPSGVKREVARDDTGRKALRFLAEAGAFAGDRDFAQLRTAFDSRGFRAAFGDVGTGKAVTVRVRATDEFTRNAEIVFEQNDGGCWGADVPLEKDWRDVRIPIKDFKPYWNTRRGDGTSPNLGDVAFVTISFGRWLYEGSLDKPHGFEISSIKAEF